MSNNNRRSAHKRSVSGVLLVDKPQGMTSQQVVSKVKYLLQSPQHSSKKAGHTGTLDPMATGLLPVCLGEATKFSHYQLHADKGYHAVIQLGASTDTGDAEGSVIARCGLTDNLDTQRLQAVAQAFTGAQQQIPPMYSALKKDGKKLYELARQGIEIEREARPIIIHQLDIARHEDDQLTLHVRCSKGTYIRVLGEDIAKALGTLGHLSALRRVSVGEFAVADAVTLAQLASMSHEQRLALLLPVDACIHDLPSLQLDAEQSQRIAHGQRLNVSAQMDEPLRAYVAAGHCDTADSGVAAGDVRLFNADGVFIGLGSLGGQGRLQPKKLCQIG